MPIILTHRYINSYFPSFFTGEKKIRKSTFREIYGKKIKKSNLPQIPCQNDGDANVDPDDVCYVVNQVHDEDSDVNDLEDTDFVWRPGIGGLRYYCGRFANGYDNCLRWVVFDDDDDGYGGGLHHEEVVPQLPCRLYPLDPLEETLVRDLLLMEGDCTGA